MGTYDYIKCEYPLPDHPELQNDLFQTKDTPKPSFENYVITKEGRLLWQEVRYEKFDPDAEGLERYHPVPTGRVVDQEHDGFVRMCTSRGSLANFDFYEYRVEFKNGKVVAIERVSED